MKSRRQRLSCYLLTVAGALLLSGCYGRGVSYDSSVTGSVTIDGQLANGGTVTFHPSGDGPMAIGPIYADGTYMLQVGQGRLGSPDKGTLPSGDYVATVVVLYQAGDQELAAGAPPDPGPYLIDEKYRSQETSDLRYTVKPGKNIINLELQRRVVEDASDDETGDETGKAAPDSSVERPTPEDEAAANSNPPSTATEDEDE